MRACKVERARSAEWCPMDTTIIEGCVCDRFKARGEVRFRDIIELCRQGVGDVKGGTAIIQRVAQ